jgi:hypothetical protein
MGTNVLPRNLVSGEGTRLDPLTVRVKPLRTFVKITKALILC